MGLWSSVNQKPDSWWERKTSREDAFAQNRRGLRECGGTDGQELPSPRRSSRALTSKEKRDIDKILRKGKQKRGKKG